MKSALAEPTLRCALSMLNWIGLVRSVRFGSARFGSAAIPVTTVEPLRSIPSVGCPIEIEAYIGGHNKPQHYIASFRQETQNLSGTQMRLY